MRICYVTIKTDDTRLTACNFVYNGVTVLKLCTITEDVAAKLVVKPNHINNPILIIEGHTKLAGEKRKGF